LDAGVFDLFAPGVVLFAWILLPMAVPSAPLTLGWVPWLGLAAGVLALRHS